MAILLFLVKQIHHTIYDDSAILAEQKIFFYMLLHRFIKQNRWEIGCINP